MALSIQLKDSAADPAGLDLAVAGDVVSDFRVNGEQLVQIGQALRAANATPRNRGNVTNRLTLALTLAPESTPDVAKQAAAALVAALRDKLATATVLDLTFATALFRLSDAALQSYDIAARGSTVFATYTFAGGDFSEVP
ncbi:MAG: hypothetical protein HZA93_23870 [Verrucomicrobia bacterium]|nr:hypothetical protein [Verrucomicrobiota bacterium]